jgi:hypothetical protein
MGSSVAFELPTRSVARHWLSSIRLYPRPVFNRLSGLLHRLICLGSLQFGVVCRVRLVFVIANESDRPESDKYGQIFNLHWSFCMPKI